MGQVRDHIFEIDRIESLPVPALLAAVRKRGFAAVRGLFPKAEVRAAHEKIKAAFDATRDHPGMGESAGAAMKNFQKLIVGGGAQRSYYVPRFLRVMYNPIWEEDVYGMRAMFARLARLRNRIQGHPLDFAVERMDDSLWTAARLQHYPAGGGFFARHQDAIASTVTEEAGLLKFIQILLLITERGKDFSSGGAFVESDGKKLDLEAECGTGDVLIYDGRSVHGVDDIDPHLLPDLRSAAGRFVALATLYTDLTQKPGQYEQYRSREYQDTMQHP
jgi:hypothetical protein